MAKGFDLGPSERSRETTDPHGDRMDRPPADEAHDLVADLLEGESGNDRVTVVGRELEGTREAEEVGQMEQVDMEGVALDPLAAVQEPTKGTNLRVDSDGQRTLERVDGGHLVGNRADPADPGDDVDHLVRRASDDESLEVTRGLEDLESRRFDDTVSNAEAERTLALDACQARDVDGEVARRDDLLISAVHRSPRLR